MQWKTDDRSRHACSEVPLRCAYTSGGIDLGSRGSIKMFPWISFRCRDLWACRSDGPWPFNFCTRYFPDRRRQAHHEKARQFFGSLPGCNDQYYCGHYAAGGYAWWRTEDCYWFRCGRRTQHCHIQADCACRSALKIKGILWAGSE